MHKGIINHNKKWRTPDYGLAYVCSFAMFVGYKKADHFSIQPSDQGPQEGLKGYQGVFKFSGKKTDFDQYLLWKSF